MIILFHVVTRPAQSGVVIFGKLPRDLWAYKWYLCILYIPVHYMLTELCDIHRDTKEILIPLEIVVDVLLYNGPFLIVLLRLLYWAWKVAYDEAVLTGAIFEDEDVESSHSGGTFTRGQRRTGGTRGGDYVGLAMVDMDEGQGVSNQGPKPSTSSEDTKDSTDGPSDGIYVIEEDDDESPAPVSVLKKPFNSPDKSPNLDKKPVKKSVMFDVDTTDEDGTGNEPHSSKHEDQQGQDRVEDEHDKDEDEEQGQGQEHIPLV
ncbi:hypothetical protein BGZ76_008431 [Entomortierella beljakovae]|nr:hypothetical protein BGZ76_008431 [Entomortierella beljakovae]